MHLFRKYLLSVEHLPDTVVGPGDTAVNKNRKMSRS